MKKGKKVLSVVLSFLVAFASMPVMYTATAASGTIDNPTLPVGENGGYSQTETNNLTFSQKSLNFTFYQTVDDEYFKFNQNVDADKYCGSANINKTVNVNVSFALDSDAATTSFMNNNSASITYTGKDSASATLPFPESSSLAGSYWDTTEYSWTKTTTFKGASADQKGQQNYSYTQLLNHSVAIINSDNVTESENSYSTPITTKITVIDARDFVAELSKAESVVANPGNHSSAYVSAVQAMLNDMPETLKNLSVVYSQSIINSYTDALASIPENAADYTEFNRVYAECKAFINDGTYSEGSYNAYIAEIESINAGLPKNLDASQQEFVNAAIQAMKNAEELLVIEFAGTGSTTQSDIEDVTPVVGNVFNFIQIEDDQVLAFSQPWTIHRGSKSSDRMFYITLDTTDANTAAFAPKFTGDCVETVASITSGAFEGALTNQTIFTNWQEVEENGTPKADVDAIKDGCIDPEYDGFKGETKYYFRNRLSFTGLSAGEAGPKTYTYVQRFYVNWTSWAFGTVNHYNSTTYTTTLNITDARALVEEYNEAVQSLQNPELHSTAYLTELQKIVDSVPQDMVNGTKYYTQAEVDAYYEQFAVLSENRADYSALDAAYARIEEILANPDAYSGPTLEAARNAKAQADAFDKNLFDSVSNRQAIAGMAATLNSVADNAETRANYDTYNQYLAIIDGINPAQYTGDAYTEFMEVVESVKSTLPLDLGESQQGTVNAACDTLLNAYLKLTGGSITDPDSVEAPFTQDAITGEYTNGVIKFTLNYPEYNFTQTINDEKLSIKTDLTISSADSSKVVTLKSLKISSLDGIELATMDTSGNCYNSDSVTVNNAENVFIVPNIQYNIVQGVDLLLDANGSQYADTNGDLAWFNTWQNTAGVALSEDGLIKETTLTTEDSSATAEFIFASAGGGDTASKLRSYTYVLRLAWTEDGVEHHAHIPVTYNISDARYLHQTYYSYMDFINAGNDGTYTNASFQAAADIMNSVNTDIVTGNGFYTQEQIDAETAKLGNALTSLKAKADYSEVNSLTEQAKAILNNTEKTYTQSSIDALNNALAQAEALNKDLEANDANNAIIKDVANALQSAISGATEKANYTEFDKVVEELENIVKNPDDYTSDTVQNAQDALNEVKDVSKDLPATEQDALDEITAGLKEVADSAEKKADYTDYNKAKAEADAVTNDGNVYNQDAYDAYKEAVNNVDTKLEKDLPESEQDTVNNAVTELENLKATLENNKNADYSEFNQLKDILEQIVNAPAGTYTEEAVKNAQDALDEANKIPSDMVVGENNVNQEMINEATQNMKDVIDSVEKRADYTEFDKVVDELKNIVNNPDDYTSDSVQKAQDALDNIVDSTDKDLGETEQDELNEITAGLKEVVENAEKKADYSEFDKVVDELKNIVNNPDDYTSDSVQKAQDALDNIVDSTDKDLGETEQDELDEITAGLQEVINSTENKANYEGLDEAIQNAQTIVDAPEGEYTKESVDKAQAALDAADALNKDLPASEQQKVTDVINGLKDAYENAEKKADYSEFDKVVEELKNIVNNPDDYTSESVQKAQDALDSIVDSTDKDLPQSEQDALDEITAGLKEVVGATKEKADYTDYNNAKAEADSLVNDDGNGNPIYDEDAFDAYKEAVNNVDTALDKDLPDSEQARVDESTQALEELKTVLESKKIYTVTFIGLNGEELSSVTYVNGSAFSAVTAPALPEATETTAYVGWLNGDVYMEADTLMNGDVTLTIASELSKILANDGSTVVVEDEYVTGVNKNTTVADLKAELQNDETVVEIRDYTGAELADESLVGTGSTITLKSKYTDVVYETRTIIIYGDLDGDGDVDDDDNAKARKANVADESFYADNQRAFFLANDVNGDGYIDVFDTFTIAKIARGRVSVIKVS